MNKINYLIDRISNINYKQMLEKVDVIHEKTGKNKLSIFFDMIYCGIKYQAGYMDYWLFEMYNLNAKQRSTILTRGKNNFLINKYNDKRFNHLFENKDEFLNMFKDFIKRDFCIITDYNLNEFKNFVKKHKEFIAKPRNGSCGKGIEKIKTNNNPEELYDYLKEKKLVVCEEVIKQNKEISKINPYSINTIRVVTINDRNKPDVVACYLRIGNDKKYVDNFNSGGMVVPIEIDSGNIIYPALDKQNNLYENHPVTNTPIKGFAIPHFDEVKETALELSKIVPEVGMVGWDLSLTTKGVDVVEGNDFPGHDIYQLPPHRTDGVGVLPRFARYLRR